MMLRTFLFFWALVLCWPAFGGVRVVVPLRDIARGSLVAESDMTYATAAGQVMNGVVTAMNDIVGMETRRTLHAGETLRLQDVRRPIIVTKGATVTMIFEAPGIVLTAAGRAMSEGGMGETVTVQNQASYRQISGIVIGPGQVRAQQGSARFAGIRE
jgi:flagellar basal body P-ring formation protein FlgA